MPESIGRYRVERILGRGGFGVVYLARDDQLQRPVPIKVPHRELVSRPEIAGFYLAEARVVAGFKHPNIVTVYDLGRTDALPFFIVAEYIEGGTLADRLAADRPGRRESAELLATVAETLAYAHAHGIVHRDIKPGNILLDAGKV